MNRSSDFNTPFQNDSLDVDLETALYNSRAAFSPPPAHLRLPLSHTREEEEVFKRDIALAISASLADLKEPSACPVLGPSPAHAFSGMFSEVTLSGDSPLSLSGSPSGLRKRLEPEASHLSSSCTSYLSSPPSYGSGPAEGSASVIDLTLTDDCPGPSRPLKRRRLIVHHVDIDLTNEDDL
ncbi:hypothetical protein NUW54_g12524 [Trametes sanguinea]|uniref:Uncharacterized protein n=1 Tax=Trametes sanguinea TaxID=158606 RepID=A0ACC1MYP1_9APHY|nr:hypothetical protein NUW54_g12524 [Trametes sanguinea]